MNDFSFYFRYGWDHIISFNAFDHLLFITALIAIYDPANWKQLLVLITAFTIGHSVTLALSVYDITRFNTKWVEFLIPVTIIFTSIFNLIENNRIKKRSLKINYFLALFFGLVHGMGFANAIRFMLPRNEQIGLPVLAFNLGLEAGQVIIVMFLLFLYYLVVMKGGFPKKIWIWTLSASTLIISIYIAVTRWP